MGEWMKMVEDAGYYNHTFIPTGTDTKAFCIWEAKEGKTPVEFQEFVDGELGPSFNCLMNTCNVIDLQLSGGATPFPSFFAENAKPAEQHKPGTSKFFMVHHMFKGGKAAEWWSTFATLAGTPKMAQMESVWEMLGLKNHAFMPTGQEKDAFCIWESKNGEMTESEFQQFIDGPNGPSFGCMNNRVYTIRSDLSQDIPYAQHFSANIEDTLKERVNQMFAQDNFYENNKFDEAKYNEWVKKFYVADESKVIFIRPSGNPLDLNGFRKFMSSGMVQDRSVSLVSIERTDVLPGNQSAVVVYKDHSKFVFNGTKNDDISTWTTVWQIEQGQWKLSHAQRSTGQPPLAN